MNFCTNCGAHMEAGAVFCTSCGTKKEQAQPIAPPAPEPDVFTPEPTIAPAPSLAPPVTENKIKKSPIILICTIAAVVIIGIIGIAAVLLPSGGEGDIKDPDDISGPRQIPNAARMRIELSEDGRSFIPKTQTVDSVEILSDETEDEDEPWVHFATVLINSHDYDAELAFVQYGIMSYQRNEEKEWILTDIYADNMNLWTVSPLAGARTEIIEDAVLSSLLWQSITIDGEEWMIDESTIENISISNRNTNLANRTDAIIANVILGSEAKTAKGQIELDFIFDYAWSFIGYNGHTPFESEYRPAAEFELTNEILLDELVRHDATVLREINWAGQTITIARNEISNLTISDYESSNKGANRIYNISFDLDKDIVAFTVDAQISYSFDSMSGWVLGDFIFTPELTSIEGLNGTRWEGRYSRRNTSYGTVEGLLTFEILEVTPDGAFRVVVSANSPDSFSQSLTGLINLNNLSMLFHFENWIIEYSGGRRDVDFDGMKVQINVQNSEIKLASNASSSMNIWGFSGINVTLTDEPATPTETAESTTPDSDE